MTDDQECIEFLQEFLGYCLTPDTRHHKFVVLEGAGANGKSVFLGVVANLLGTENVSHVPLERFADRFALASTIGKLANVVNEAESVPPGVTGILKQFVAGDLMTMDLKHRDPINVKPSARLIIATNATLRFADSSEGLWRRMVSIPCLAVVAPEQQDSTLQTKLADELPGILNWALEGLARLNARGGFQLPARAREAAAAHRSQVNPARRYLQDNYSERAGRSYMSDVYSRYLSFCENEGEKPESKAHLAKEMKALFPSIRRLREGSGDREYYYEGLARLE